MNIAASESVAPYHKGIKEIPSQEYLRECFEYRDGWLFWKRRPVEHFSCTRIANGVNTRCAGCRVEAIHAPPNVTPYIIVGLNSKIYYCHRVIWNLFNGPIPDELEVDHINGNSLDNRIENLRLVTKSKNMINRPCFNKKSGLPKGVTKMRGRFVSRIRQDNTITVLGYFKTPEEAGEAYQKASETIHGEFARKPAPSQLETGPVIRAG